VCEACVVRGEAADLASGIGLLRMIALNASMPSAVSFIAMCGEPSRCGTVAKRTYFFGAPSRFTIE
jgi:hypothetical protein